MKDKDLIILEKQMEIILKAKKTLSKAFKLKIWDIDEENWFNQLLEAQNLLHLSYKNINNKINKINDISERRYKDKNGKI